MRKSEETEKELKTGHRPKEIRDKSNNLFFCCGRLELCFSLRTGFFFLIFMNERNKVKCSSSSNNERPATSVTTTNLDIQTIIMRWCRQAFVIFSYPIHCSVVSQLFAYEIGLDLIKLLAFERGWAIGFCLRFVSWGLIGCCV